MSDEAFKWPFPPPPQAVYVERPVFQPHLPQHVPQPMYPVQQNRPMMTCDYCKQEIEEGQDVVHIRIGVKRTNPQTGMPEILSAPERELDLHRDCYGPCIVEEDPATAEDIMLCMEDINHPDGRYCDKCNEQLDGESWDTVDDEPTGEGNEGGGPEGSGVPW